MDGVISKHHATLRNLLQYACSKQNMNIAVDRADVAFRPMRYLANSPYVVTIPALAQRRCNT